MLPVCWQRYKNPPPKKGGRIDEAMRKMIRDDDRGPRPIRADGGTSTASTQAAWLGTIGRPWATSISGPRTPKP